MQAVILAGGFGTRLRPLTYTRPKPLLPILNKPMIARFIETIPDEVTQIIIPVNYMGNMMKAFFEKNDFGKEIIVVDENEPLGTGGAVKNVEKYLDDSFLVLNADAITSLNLSEFISFHKEKKGIGSISLYEVENVEEFGIVELDENSRILRFKEKPKKHEIFSNLANAGAYALELEILDYIKPGFVSMEREVFPNILDKGMYGFKFEGYWLDTGRASDYINAHKILLEMREKEIGKNSVVKGAVGNHVVIGESCIIKGDIGEYTCIGSNVRIDEGSNIRDSVIMDKVKIGKNVAVENSVLGEGCVVENNIKLNHVVAGDKSRIRKGLKPSDEKIEADKEA
ncbi:MAG: NDP-sugar synthase [Candidatus Thermoplasmatota archaeon]|nr:NDP-sugar synthase [Candidatus Thermoplasmatota archaeon]